MNVHQTADCPARIKPINGESNTHNTGVIAPGNAGLTSRASLANQRSNAPHASRPIAEPRHDPFFHPFNPFDPYFQNC